MRVLVTGVSGLLGARVVRLLKQDGHWVRGSFRPGDHPRLVRELLDEAVACDLLDEPGTGRLVQGVEAVINAAAMVTFVPSLYERQMQVNVEGTRLLIDACQRAGVRRLVHTSTVNTLGAPPNGTVGDERTPDTWAPLRMGYMDSKRRSEALVLQAARDGFDALAVLPGTMFGPWDVNFNAGSYVMAAARGVLLAAPEGGTSVVHVDDVARGHLQALQRGRPGERYVLGGENLTYRELFAMICRELGRREPLVTLPLGRLRVLGRLADRLRRRFGVPLPLQEGALVAVSSRLFYSSDKACKELGYGIRPAEEAIRDAVSWYRAEGLI